MTYEEFKVEFTATFNKMMSYSPNEVGSEIYCEKLAALADEYPEYEELLLEQEASN